MAAPAWVPKVQRVLVPLVSADLTIQYILGLLTNAYAPTAGFTQNTDFGVYDGHWTNGEILGVLMIVSIVIVALRRDRPALGMSILAFLAVLVAGIAGMAFVNATPNPPGATVTMGLAFLVAFGAQQALLFRTFMSSGAAPPAPGAPSVPAPAA